MNQITNSQVRDRRAQAFAMALPAILLTVAMWAVALLSSPSVDAGLAMAAGLH